MRILVVDDERLILGYMTKAVGTAAPEAEVIPYESPYDAVDYAKDNLIDLAFLDMQMRNVLGIDVAKELRKMQPDIQIIFCSGTNEYREAAEEIGIIDYLLKPTRVEEIKEAIEKCKV